MNFFNLLIKIFIGIVIFSIVFNSILIHNTKFEKEIIIKEKYVVATNNNRLAYFVISNDNIIYNIVYLGIKGVFKSANDYALLSIGKTYRVKGYGIRVPFLGMHNTIYSVDI